MRREFVALVESRNKVLKELANGAISHIADDLGVSEEEILQKATQIGVDLEGELTADDITNIYTAFDVEEQEARKKARAEIDAIYGNKLDGQDGAGGDFVLSFADADEYRELEKDLRKGYLSSTSKLSDWMDIVGAKLRRIEDMDKQQEFHDASWKSYNNAMKKWRDSNYETNYMGDFRTGGVTVKDGQMTVDMAMRESVNELDETVLDLFTATKNKVKKGVGGLLKSGMKASGALYDKSGMKAIVDKKLNDNRLLKKFHKPLVSFWNSSTIEELENKTKELSTLRDDMNKQKARLNELEQEGASQEEIDELAAQIDSDQYGLDKLNGEIKEIQQKLVKRDSEVEKLKRENEKLKKDNEKKQEREAREAERETTK
jgi:hypothetical protein